MSAPASTHLDAGSGPQLAARADGRGSGIVVLALRRSEAAKALGVSDELFDRHVRPSLPVVRLGSVRVYPVEHLRGWLTEHAEAPCDELERRSA